MKNKLVKALSENKEVRLFLIDSTEMVENARKLYEMSPVSIAALGRTITAASMLGKTLKNDNDKLTLRINGSNEIKSIVAVSDSIGNVKGYISNPYVETKINSIGKLDVGNAVGNSGEIYIIRDYGMKKPYVGSAKLVSGEIAEDLANYFMYSEQQPTVFSLGVLVNKEGKIQSAGGLLIQTLPNVSDETITLIEEAMSNLKPISTIIDSEKNLEKVINENFSKLNFKITDVSEVNLLCDCSKERMKKALISLGEKEINDMIKEDKGADIHCHFCNTHYKFTEEELKNIIKK